MKPGPVLLKVQTWERSATLQDMRERDVTWMWVFDTSGAVMRRSIREDGVPTRWQPMIHARTKDSPEKVAERADEWLQRLQARYGSKCIVVEDNR